MNAGFCLSLALLVAVSSEVMAQCILGQVTGTGAGTTETAVVSFANLNNGNGRKAVVAGLTLDCASNASTNNSLVTPFFANLSNGSTGGTPPAGCTKSGSLSGWASGSASGNSVTFTSITPNTNVTNIVATNGASAVTTDGSAGGALTSLLTGSLVCARPGTGYPGDAGDRWQEQHRAGGQLWDYKRGVGNAIDPEKQVGTYAFSGSGLSSSVTHTYGSTAYSWKVYLHTSPNTYSFCVGFSEHARAFVIAGAGSSGNGCGGSFPP
jgi:hypothetical protein